MEQRLSEALTRRRFSTFLLGVFATVALVLAAIGIYGVMAYSVTQRTQEIGIRMALGAQPGSIKMLVLRHSLILVILGVVFGLAGAFALTRVMSMSSPLEADPVILVVPATLANNERFQMDLDAI